MIEDRDDHVVVRSPHNPKFWWGNFLLLAEPPAGPGYLALRIYRSVGFADTEVQLGAERPPA